MGKRGEDGTCVTSDFRVLGLENLRVVDLSVCPVIPRYYPATKASNHSANLIYSNHTQSTAYLVGETAAGKFIKEYGLDAIAAAA
jgi:hypothetical protein